MKYILLIVVGAMGYWLGVKFAKRKKISPNLDLEHSNILKNVGINETSILSSAGKRGGVFFT